jgi:hypothetical protein
LEEAAGWAQAFFSEDLTRTYTDLESLKAKFLETLQSSAAAAKDVAGEILHDWAMHASTYGSAVGAQLKETLAVMTHQLAAVGHTGAGVGMQMAQTTSNMLRQIAAGALTGLADHVKPGHHNQDKDKVN